MEKKKKKSERLYIEIEYLQFKKKPPFPVGVILVIGWMHTGSTAQLYLYAMCIS